MDQPPPDEPASPAAGGPSGAPIDPASSVTVNLNPHGKPTPTSPGPGCRHWIGDYELLDVVGRGGMGIVHKARHHALNRIVALKVTRDDRVLSSETALRFRREAAAVAKLDHPHIVPIYEVGESAGQLFYSMAFIEGISLAQLVAVAPLTSERAAAILQPVIAAIAYAHSQGVVHRDLKPENILLDGADRPRVTDFGAAVCSDNDSRLTMAGEVLGTPSYMSPEQAQGGPHEVGPRSDVYSLGATLYCLLTGRPPFRAAIPLETLKQVVEREPVAPRQLNPAVDRDLETICLKCLEKSPERRYASATALADDLARFLDQRPILARPVSPIEKAARWCRRSPYVAGLLASLVGVFLTAFALVSWSYWRTQAALQEEATQRGLASAAGDDARAHERAERWERYRANLVAASSAFQSQNIGVARQAIEDAPAVHRNWEWRHFAHQLDQSRQVFASTDAGVRTVRFAGNGRVVVFDKGLHVQDLGTGRRTSLTDFELGAWRVDPQGRLLAYSTKEMDIVLWDLDANRRLLLLAGSGAGVESVEFSQDSMLLAATTNRAEAFVWDLGTGAKIHSWTLDAGSREAVGSEIGAGLLAGRRFKEGLVGVWDLASGRKRFDLTGHHEHAIHTEFNKQGTRIVTADVYPSNAVRMWNAETGKLIAELRGHTNQTLETRFSPDGRVLATCSYDQTVRLWDGMTGAPIATLRGHAGRVLTIAFSPDGKRLASGSQDHSVRLWDATDGSPIAVLHGHDYDVHSLDFSPDGALIASGSSDRTTRVWDVRSAERNGVLRGHASFVYGVAFLPDGERLASAGWDGTVHLWNASSCQETAVLRNPDKTIINSIAVDPAGKLLATLGRDNAVRLWDIDAARQVHVWAAPSDDWQDSRLAFSPAGNLLAVGCHDGSVRIWDVPTRVEWAELRGHRDHVYDVAFSPDGRWLASASGEADRSVRIWDVAAKEARQVLDVQPDTVVGLAVSRDGSILASGSREGAVRLWDTVTWKQTAVLKHGTAIYAVAFAADGTRLATGCADNSIRLWDVPTGQQVAELRGHESYVKALSFSPDGTRVASASGDRTVRVWDTISARDRGRIERGR
jgi:eukaryotic-like serine/threonine-protein kinase